MSLQPGVGYSFTSSGSGTTLDINQPWTPSESALPVEQFTVIMNGDNVMVAKGRVVAQALTGMPTTKTYEYDVKGFAVYPTDKLTEGTDAASVWCSQGGTVEIANADNDGSNAWGVYLIRNEGNTGEEGQVIMPFLAVMADGSEAESYSKPWNSTGQHGDLREYYIIRQKQSVEITTPTEVVYGAVVQSFHGSIQRYNCQRIKIASLNWYAPTGWQITQHLIGTLYMPNNVHYYGELEYENGDDAPDADWPLNSAENEDWSGAWSGYTKNFNTGGLTRTSEILV